MNNSSKKTIIDSISTLFKIGGQPTPSKAKKTNPVWADNVERSVNELLKPMLAEGKCDIGTYGTHLPGALGKIVSVIEDKFSDQDDVCYRILFDCDSSGVGSGKWHENIIGDGRDLSHAQKMRYLKEMGMSISTSRELMAIRAIPLLQKRRIQVRWFSRDKFKKETGQNVTAYHAKLYLSPSYAIFGSANFSHRGLNYGGNIERSGRFQRVRSDDEDSDYKNHRDQWDRDWSCGEDVNDEIVKWLESLLRGVTPEAAICRYLASFYTDESLTLPEWEVKRCCGGKITEYLEWQERAIPYVMHTIYTYRYGTLSAEPGCGKTMVGQIVAVLMRKMHERICPHDYSGGQKSTLNHATVIGPRSMYKAWGEGLRHFMTPNRVGKFQDDDVRSELLNTKQTVIDESHELIPQVRRMDKEDTRGRGWGPSKAGEGIRYINGSFVLFLSATPLGSRTIDEWAWLIESMLSQNFGDHMVRAFKEMLNAAKQGEEQFLEALKRTGVLDGIVHFGWNDVGIQSDNTDRESNKFPIWRFDKTRAIKSCNSEKDALTHLYELLVAAKMPRESKQSDKIAYRHKPGKPEIHDEVSLPARNINHLMRQCPEAARMMLKDGSHGMRLKEATEKARDAYDAKVREIKEKYKNDLYPDWTFKQALVGNGLPLEFQDYYAEACAWIDNTWIKHAEKKWRKDTIRHVTRRGNPLYIAENLLPLAIIANLLAETYPDHKVLAFFKLPSKKRGWSSREVEDENGNKSIEVLIPLERVPLHDRVKTISLAEAEEYVGSDGKLVGEERVIGLITYDGAVGLNMPVFSRIVLMGLNTDSSDLIQSCSRIYRPNQPCKYTHVTLGGLWMPEVASDTKMSDRLKRQYIFRGVNPPSVEAPDDPELANFKLAESLMREPRQRGTHNFTDNMETMRSRVIDGGLDTYKKIHRWCSEGTLDEWYTGLSVFDAGNDAPSVFFQFRGESRDGRFLPWTTVQKTENDVIRDDTTISAYLTRCAESTKEAGRWNVPATYDDIVNEAVVEKLHTIREYNLRAPRLDGLIESLTEALSTMTDKHRGKSQEELFEDLSLTAIELLSRMWEDVLEPHRRKRLEWVEDEAGAKKKMEGYTSPMNVLLDIREGRKRDLESTKITRQDKADLKDGVARVSELYHQVILDYPANDAKNVRSRLETVFICKRQR